jgi:hypothetical protein
MQGCAVCENPRKPDLSRSQIEWHNQGHPGLAELSRQADRRKLRSVVIIRPGDQILYEIRPGNWRSIDEMDVAIAAGYSINELAVSCRRCSRLVLERRPGAISIWRSLLERIALRAIRQRSD